MHTKTMEGLIGARTNINLVNTPMRVYKEARRKDDFATMERAMGYAGEFAGKAEEYKTEADEGMKEDVKEAREEAESLREQAVEKRREEKEKLQERIEESRKENQDTNTDAGTDTVEISEEGKVLLKGNTDFGSTDSDGTKADIIREPVTYSKTGELSQTEQSGKISVSV